MQDSGKVSLSTTVSSNNNLRNEKKRKRDSESSISKTTSAFTGIKMVFRRLWKKIRKEPKDESDARSVESGSTARSASIAFEPEALAKTEFPAFDHVPDGENSEDDSDSDDLEKSRKSELTYEMLAAKYETKEDQDVAVFLALADRMSMSSLLHILQGHVRSENLDIHQYSDIANLEKSKRERRPSQQAAPKPKMFRWAEVTDGKVRVAVHEVECLKAMKNLWWKASEMRTIQMELVETVQFFRRYRHDYIESVEVIAQRSDKLPEQIVETHMKNLTKDTYTRGLEAHIVKLLSANRKKTVNAVMEEQHECAADEYDIKSRCLREQSLAYSKLSRTFAQKMGQCDEIIALKANLSAW
jgi:hypothetical protein